MLGVHKANDLRTAPARRRGSMPIFSMTPRPEFAPRSTGYEVTTGVLVPIHIRCRDKGTSSMQQIDGSRVTVGGRLPATASYTDRKPKFRRLCGLI